MPRKAKTLTEHLNEGTYRPHRHGPLKPTAKALDTLPDPPFDLDEQAKSIFKTVGESLIAQGILKDTDLHTLACYAIETAIYQNQTVLAANEIVTVLSNGVTCVSHNRRAAETALKNMVLLGDRLGLSPKSRFGMVANVPQPDKRERQISILDYIKNGTIPRTN